MKSSDLNRLLASVRDEAISPEDAARLLAPLVGAAPPEPARHRIDLDRQNRCGIPEVVFGPGKEPGDVGRIAKEIVDAGQDLLITRTTEEAFAAVRSLVPDAVHHPRARAITRRRGDAPGPRGLVAVVTAGTGDVPVAEEARLTLEVFGSRVETHYDVGVAGLHRVLAVRDTIDRANAVIVCAGMEGALASVVAGLVRRPVIAVPTSIGYGVSFGGLAAMLGMLNACASVAVVNIDNGYGAGLFAHRINLQSSPIDQAATREPA